MKTNRVNRHRPARTAAILAMAIASPALAVDKSFLVANGVWGNAGNWAPLGVPTAIDNAFVGNAAGAVNGVVSLGFDANALNLIVTDGMTLRTQLFAATIAGHTNLAGFNDPAGPDFFRSGIQVDDGAAAIDFQTNTLTAEDGALVRLSSGRMRVNGLFDLKSTASLSGNGTLDLHSNAAGPAMIVNGSIVPAGGFDIRIHQNGTAPVDLDGTLESDSTINITGTSGFSYSAFVLRGTHLNDAFGDTINIGRGNIVNLDLDNGWTLSQFGEVNFVHDPARTEAAHLTGATMTIQGAVTVDAGGRGLVNSDVVIQSTADITVGGGASLTFNQEATINGGVFTIPNGSELGFNSPVRINGGTFNASGTGDVTFTGFTTYAGNPHFTGITRQVGDATVSSASTIHGGTFDMDGVNFTDWHVNAPLTVNANEIDFGGGAFSGTLNINAPNAFTPVYVDMNVQTLGGWTMDGTMNLVGPGGGVVHANTVRGSDFNVAGVVNVAGGHAPSARLNVAGGTIDINAGGGLRLDGGTIADPNTIDGGRILGAGSLRSLANHALVGSGTIGATVDFDGNAELRADGGILRITGAIADVGVIGTASPTGQLNVANPWNTGVAERVELLGGLVNGAQITNDRQITGHGSVVATGIINNGSISAVGGELVINASGGQPLDLDGTSGTAQIFALDGNLTIVDEPSDNFDGDAVVGPGRTMTFQNGWHTSAAANLSLTGAPLNPAVIAGDGQSLFGSNVYVSGPVRFDILTLLNNGTDVQTAAAGDSLTLTKNTYVDSGVTFTGPGELRNASTGSLQLGEGANVGIRLVNSGPLGIDFTNQTGIASAQRFEQTSGGSMQVQLAGAVPGNDFDRLNVAEDAHLAGRLELSMLAGYEPEYLVPHEILRAGTVSGLFGTVPDNMINPSKYLAVVYDADSVIVAAALPGDANLDGTVNIADFAVLASNFNTPGGWQDGNFNGDVRTDIGDFSLMGTNFNVSIPGGVPDGALGPFGMTGGGMAARASAVPEPAATASLILALPMLLNRRRGRRPTEVGNS